MRHRLTAGGERLRQAGSEVVKDVMGACLGRLSQADLATPHRLLLAAGGD